jgi:hypothetical protein
VASIASLNPDPIRPFEILGVHSDEALLDERMLDNRIVGLI